MPNLNRVMLMGNLTRDPELRYLPSNIPVVSIGLAVNRRWRNQQGEQQEETTFVDCEGFGRTAELINQYLKKGRPVFIDGRLKLDQWQDKEGHNRSKLKVVIENFQFIDSRSSDDAPASSAEGYPARSQPQPQPHGGGPAGTAAPRPGAGGAPVGNDAHRPVAEDDIPF
jgi:single-strand DNA-binding protein